jgi:hypothetical protein
MQSRIVRRVTHAGPIVPPTARPRYRSCWALRPDPVFHRGPVIAGRPAESFDFRTLVPAINPGEVPEHQEEEELR